MHRKTPAKLSRFILVGGSVLGVGLAMMYLLVDMLYWPERVANVAQLGFTLWLNYTISKRFVWTGCESTGTARRFLISRAITQLVSYLLFEQAIQHGIHYLVATAVIGIVIGVVANFVSADKWVFKDAGPDRLYADLSKLRLGWGTLNAVVVTVLALVLSLYLLMGKLFVPTLLLTVAVVCLVMAIFFVATQIYAHSDHMSLDRLRLEDPRGASQHRIGLLMPAKRGEPQMYAETILHTLWSQRKHRNYFVAPLLYSDDYDGLRNVVAVWKTWLYWQVMQESGMPLSYADLRGHLAQLLDALPQGQAVLKPKDIFDLDGLRRDDTVIRLRVFDVGLLNGRKRSKPIKLNYAFNEFEQDPAEAETVYGIVDAETRYGNRLLEYVDWALQMDPDLDVLQGAVLLRGPRFAGTLASRAWQFCKRWYAWHNMLEYYTCFQGLVPLQVDNDYLSWAGNTVFIRARVLRRIGGWPETLTEDNAAGTKASVRGAKVRSFFNPELASWEETPGSFLDWLFQRIRWNAGFLDTFLQGEWRLLPTARQRRMAFWIMACPFLLAATAVLWTVTVTTIVLGVDSPALYVVAMFFSVVAMAVSAVLTLLQMRDFSKSTGEPVPWFVYPWMLLTMLPYQLCQGVAATMACRKHFSGDRSWHTPQRSGDNAAQSARQGTAHARPDQSDNRFTPVR